MLPGQRINHGYSEIMKRYGIPSQRAIICVRILNYANYQIMCSITYTFNMSKLIFIRAVLPNTLQKLVEATVMTLTSKHTCTTLIKSCKETSLPV